MRTFWNSSVFKWPPSSVFPISRSRTAEQVGTAELAQGHAQGNRCRAAQNPASRPISLWVGTWLVEGRARRGGAHWCQPCGFQAPTLVPRHPAVPVLCPQLTRAPVAGGCLTGFVPSLLVPREERQDFGKHGTETRLALQHAKERSTANQEQPSLWLGD